MQPQVADIQSQVNNATYGLAALKTFLDAMNLLVADSNSILNSGTIGNQAIIDAIADKASQTSLNNLIGTVDNIAGAGFDTGTDSLKQISDRQFTGGSAV
jgi:hypothetical protein